MTYEDIKAELEALTAGLLYISETERPFEVLEVPGDAIRFFAEVSKIPAADFGSSDANDFFNKTIRNAAEDPEDMVMLQLAKRYEMLLQFLNAHFSVLQLYRAGNPEAHIFILGQTAAGEQLALHTTAVAT